MRAPVSHVLTHSPLSFQTRIFLSLSDRKIRVWNDNGECVNTWDTGALIYCLVVGKDFLCSGNSNGSIQLWNEYGKCFSNLKGHTDTVGCLLVHENFLYSGSDDFT